jgi:regulator of protease activity HflC (stomatin/prohibitin superfamily)
MKIVLKLSSFIIVILGFMAVTKIGFGIIEGHEIGVKKEGTTYVMQEYNPGYYFYIPKYSTLEDVNGRPVMFNWSKSDSEKESTDEMRYNKMITGVDKNGIPLSFALAMEVTPVKNMMAEMFQETGSYENALDKKAIQPSKSIIKNVMGSFDAKDIQSKRTEVSAMLNKLLTEFYLKNKYFRLDSTIDLKEIEVPESVLAVQLKVQNSKQLTEVVRQEVLKAKQEAEKKAALAQGEADRLRIEAQGRSDAVLIEAQAQAKANVLLSKSLTDKIIRIQTVEAWKHGGSKVPKYVGSKESQFIMKME